MPHRTFTTALLLILSLTLLACGGTAPAAEPPAEAAVTTAPTPPTLEPTRRTPIPTLNPRQVEGTQEAKVAEIQTQYAPTPTPYIIPTVPPPIVIPTLAPPPIIPPMPPAIPTPAIIILPTPTPVAITIPTVAPPTPVPLPTLRPFTVTTATPPVPASWKVSGEVRQFARVCGELGVAGDAVVTGGEFDEWVDLLLEVQAPPELAEWWTAYVNQFALQTEVGPNAATQEAADDEYWYITQMTEPVQDVLMEAGCITGYDVALAYETGYAWARYEAGYGQGPDTTIEEFAQACADMKVTIPAMDAVSEAPWHLYYWWTQLNPPQEIQGYYDAVLDFYQEWALAGTGDINDVSHETAMAVQAAAQALDGDDLELLLRERCAG